jgi:hypothetical protein
VEVRVWNPPVSDSFARLLYAFLPPSEGGGDVPTKLRPQGRLVFFHLESVPWNLLPEFFRPDFLGGDLGDKIRAQFVGRMTQLSQPGQARDLIHRGQFGEATEQLVALRSQLDKRPTSVSDLEASSANWSKAVLSSFADLQVAERKAKRGDPTGFAEQTEARTKLDSLWNRREMPMRYIDVLASEPVTAEATYLLALCKHEQAEQLRRTRRGASDPGAWQAALTWWNHFVSNYTTGPATSAARRNLAFALAGAGRKAEARTTLAALVNSDLSPLEKLACKYWESQWK